MPDEETEQDEAEEPETEEPEAEEAPSLASWIGLDNFDFGLSQLNFGI